MTIGTNCIGLVDTVPPGEFVDDHTCLPHSEFDSELVHDGNTICDYCAFNGRNTETTEECDSHLCGGVVWVDRLTYAKYRLAGIKGVKPS